MFNWISCRFGKKIASRYFERIDFFKHLFPGFLLGDSRHYQNTAKYLLATHAMKD
jgi:hypothetical protein